MCGIQCPSEERCDGGTLLPVGETFDVPQFFTLQTDTRGVRSVSPGPVSPGNSPCTVGSFRSLVQTEMFDWCRWL